MACMVSVKLVELRASLKGCLVMLSSQNQRQRPCNQTLATDIPSPRNPLAPSHSPCMIRFLDPKTLNTEVLRCSGYFGDMDQAALLLDSQLWSFSLACCQELGTPEPRAAC